MRQRLWLKQYHLEIGLRYPTLHLYKEAHLGSVGGGRGLSRQRAQVKGQIRRLTGIVQTQLKPSLGQAVSAVLYFYLLHGGLHEEGPNTDSNIQCSDSGRRLRTPNW